MRYLLDTCTFLWVVAGDKAIPERVRELIVSPENEVLLSVVSAWEIVAKHKLGKLPLPVRAERFVREQREAHGFDSLSLTEAHTLMLSRLTDLHRDPFDRMLICQALAEGIPVLTPDELIAQYPVQMYW